MNRWLRTGMVAALSTTLLTACGMGGAAVPEAPADRQMSFTAAPEMTIDVSKSYSAVVETSKGQFTIELFAKEAPITVNSFVFLSKQRYFEDIVFHRIVPDYIIQTGDPTGTGRGGPGYSFTDELGSPYEYAPGIVAMANSGPNTNGSQFFICTGEWSKNLNQMPNYTIFGRVTAGMDTVLAIGNTPVAGETPTETITIESVTIQES
jgi:cyclophilin family peptidyl-prolyl cis-trans isomerase